MRNTAIAVNHTNKKPCFTLSSFSLALAITMGFSSILLPDTAKAEVGKKWAKGQILVKAAPGINEERLNHILASSGGKSLGKIQQIGVHIIEVPAHTEEKVVAALSNNPNIEFAELDMLVPLSETTPSDPRYSSQWHLPQINAPVAWDSSMGDGVTVAIVDTGVYSGHVDLAANMLPGFNTVDNTTDSSDIMGHGTAVAGTVGAVANNGTGIASVAWNVRLLPVRVSNRTDGVAQWSDLAEGISWAADNGAQVANVSYSVSNSSTISNAASYMKSKGGVVVSSAGNSGNDLGYGDNPHIITVSATEKNDVITSWSSYGNMLDVTAPGYYIYTTNKSGSYSNWNGTSFSSPVVAGVAALVMSANPSLTPDEVETVLEATAKDLGTAGWDNKYGHGRVDAGAAVLAALDSQPVPDTEAPTISISNLVDGQQVSGDVSITTDTNDNVGVTRVELWIDGNIEATDSNSPFAFNWDSNSVFNGLHSIEVRAFDAAGNSASNSINVDVLNEVIIDTEAPQVSITSPADGDTVSGTVKINISASDDNHVAMLSCFIDGNLLATSNDVTSLVCNWNTRKLKGTHTIMARAEDSAGNIAETMISVTIDSTSGGGNKGGGKGKNK